MKNKLCQLAALILSALFLSGCATTGNFSVDSAMERDLTNVVNYHLSIVDGLESRLEHSDSNQQFIQTMEYTVTSFRSLDARYKLLLTRYPEMKRTRPENLPSPLKEIMMRRNQQLREKAYVFRSLQASLIRHGSHPSVMKAMQNLSKVPKN